MKLGLENLSPAVPEPVVIDMEALAAELDGFDAISGSFAASEQTMTECEKVAGVIAEFGFGDELNAMFGDEIRAAGIDTELSKEEIAASIVFAADMDMSEEGFKELLAGIPALKDLPQNMWISLKNIWGAFTAKIGKFASVNGKGGQVAANTKNAAKGLWSKVGPFLKGVNPLVWVALASVATIVITIKLINSANIKKLMTNNVNLKGDDDLTKLLEKEEKTVTAESMKAKLEGSVKVAKELLGTSITKLDAGKVEEMGKTVTVKLETVGGGGKAAGYSKSGIVAQHKAAMEAFAVMDGLVKAVGSAKPSDEDKELDNALIKATKDVAVDTVKSLNECVKAHIKFVKNYVG